MIGMVHVKPRITFNRQRFGLGCDSDFSVGFVRSLLRRLPPTTQGRSASRRVSSECLRFPYPAKHRRGQKNTLKSVHYVPRAIGAAIPVITNSLLGVS